MKTLKTEALLETAIEAAQAAGTHALEQRHRRNVVARREAHDVKLQLDLECQQKAVEAIHRQYPGHPVLGEEGGISGPEAQPCWIIDPIDGTVNFLHGLPLWCNAVAVRAGNEIVAGAVYVPEMNDLYTATADGDALLNGTPMQPSGTSHLNEALVMTGLTKKIEEHPDAVRQIERLSRHVQKVRIMGAAAIDICHVARGMGDAYVELSIRLWDIAAAGLIARRAGVRTHVLQQFDETHLAFMCANPILFEPLRKLLADE
jgi:myo-inositol-1(or 4)-monophosphatase